MSFSDQENAGIPLGDNFADLLTRVDKIPLEKVVETAAKYDCSQEFAGVIYLLNNDLEIDPQLILSDLNGELKRLEKAGSEIPKVETYMYNFAITEGKWIAYLRGALAKSLIDDIKNFQSLISKMSKIKGSDLITLATQIMMERQFIAANKLIPVIEKWVDEHTNSTELSSSQNIFLYY